MEKQNSVDVDTPLKSTKKKMKKLKSLEQRNVDTLSTQELINGVSEKKKKKKRKEVEMEQDSECSEGTPMKKQKILKDNVNLNETPKKQNQLHEINKDASAMNKGIMKLKKSKKDVVQVTNGVKETASSPSKKADKHNKSKVVDEIDKDASQLNETPMKLKKSKKDVSFQDITDLKESAPTSSKKVKKLKSVEFNDTPGKTKRDKRPKETEESEEDLYNSICELVGSPSTPPKKKSKKSKLESDTDAEIIDNNIEDDLLIDSEEINPKASEIEFSQEDLQILMDNIEGLLPINDNLAAKTRSKKIDWEKVSFNGHTAEDCRETWDNIMKKQRQFRYLGEILSDVKEWLHDQKFSFKNHPDFPKKKPLSGYMLYYKDHQKEVTKQNPGTNMVERSRIIADSYKQISEEEKKKYTQLAAQKKALYDAKVEEFFKAHPDFRGYDNGKPPKKPSTPIALYQEHIQSKVRAGEEEEASKHDLKGRWKLLSDEDRLVWIEKAAEQQVNFYNKVKEYQSAHPDYTVSLKHVLTKEEKQLLDKSKGKPDKPPTTAYLLFVNKYVKKHADDMSDMSSKEQKKICSQKWHELTTEERRKYQTKLDTLTANFKVDNAAYLQSLPDNEREQELKNTPKKLQEDPMEKFANMATPVCWDKMLVKEKYVYMRYLKKIKRFFDAKHGLNPTDNEEDDELEVVDEGEEEEAEDNEDVDVENTK